MRSCKIVKTVSLAIPLAACVGRFGAAGFGGGGFGFVGGYARTPPPGPPAFQDGYVDGCVTGYSDALREGYENAARRDTQRYGSDAAYKRGFDQGRAACYEEERSHPTMIFQSR